MSRNNQSGNYVNANGDVKFEYYKTVVKGNRTIISVFIGLIIIIAIGVIFLSKPSIEKQIVGSWDWTDASDEGYINTDWIFDGDGNASIGLGKYILTGVYSISDNDNIIINVSYLWASETITASIKINGDKIILSNISDTMNIFEKIEELVLTKK